jgi:hypothetical protein
MMTEDDETSTGQATEEELDEDQSGEEQVDPSASVLIHNYLLSEKGNEIAQLVLDLFKGIKRSTLDRNVEQDKVTAEQNRLQLELLHKHYGRVLTLQTLVFALAIIAATFLTYVGKFESPVAILFGTLVGYFFGRKSSKDG